MLILVSIFIFNEKNLKLITVMLMILIMSIKFYLYVICINPNNFEMTLYQVDFFFGNKHTFIVYLI